MLALVQRVSHAEVKVDQQIIGKINQGILILLGIQPNDTTTQVEHLINRILNYRIFSDEQERMNLSVMDINGGILIVPQFTLAADTHKGLRPSFSTAASPTLAEELFNVFVRRANELYHQVACGKFGADMKVSLCNDGPVTFLLDANA